MAKITIKNVEEILYESFLAQFCNKYLKGFKDDGKNSSAKVKKKFGTKDGNFNRENAYRKRKSQLKGVETSKRSKRKILRSKNSSESNWSDEEGTVGSLTFWNSKEESTSDIEMIEERVKSNKFKRLKENSTPKRNPKTSVIEISADPSEKADLDNSEGVSDANLCASLEKSVLDKKIWECPICFEQSKGQEIVTTMCGHVFCKKCLESHCATKMKCPSCRFDLSNTKFITLYNV